MSSSNGNMFHAHFSDGQPLSGVVVIDMARGVPGPYCSLLLASLGATVISIEAPSGDVFRHVSGGAHAVSLRRGKLSVVLDLKSEEGTSRGSTLI
jgi:CoA:oxalate CoA-transferase